jgi:hypothetical protein
MTGIPPEPAPGRRWPWSSRTSLASDVGLALTLFVGEALLFVWKSFGYGLQAWAAQGAAGGIDAAQLASIAWTEHFLLATLALLGLAALARAPWTAVSQLLVAGALAVVLVLSQHEYSRDHPGPAPAPSAGYSPCYSGGDNCP